MDSPQQSKRWERVSVSSAGTSQPATNTPGQRRVCLFPQNTTPPTPHPKLIFSTSSHQHPPQLLIAHQSRTSASPPLASTAPAQTSAPPRTPSPGEPLTVVVATAHGDERVQVHAPLLVSREVFTCFVCGHLLLDELDTELALCAPGAAPVPLAALPWEPQTLLRDARLVVRPRGGSPAAAATPGSGSLAAAGTPDTTDAPDAFSVDAPSASGSGSGDAQRLFAKVGTSILFVFSLSLSLAAAFLCAITLCEHTGARSPRCAHQVVAAVAAVAVRRRRPGRW